MKVIKQDDIIKINNIVPHWRIYLTMEMLA